MGLYEKIQKATPAGVWGQGVELARAGAVIGERKDDDGIVLTVLPVGAFKPLEVWLWPDDEDWSCSCKESARATGGCAHVAAAVIAMRRAGEQGAALPKPKATLGHLGYRFRRDKDGAVSWLSLERVLVRGGHDIPLSGTLSALRQRSTEPLLISDADLRVEDLVGFRTGRFRPAREAMARLLQLLSEATDLTLDGAPARASSEAIGPVGRVEDADDGGFRLRLVRDARVTEGFQNGAVLLAGGALHASSKGGLDDEQYGTLSRGVSYPPHQAARLVGEMLPRLKAKIQVDVRTKRLPKSGAVPPRITLELSGLGETLWVTAGLVYGDPPVAKVERGQLHLLGGAVPLRDEAAERKLVEELREGLGMTPGLRLEATGEAAVKLAARVRGFRGAKAEGEALARFQKVGPLEPLLQLDGDALSVQFRSAAGEADPARVFQSWREGAELVPLLGGGWAPLPRAWLDRHGHLLADLLASRDARGKVAKYALFDLAKLAETLNQPPPPALDGVRALIQDYAGLPEAPLPPGLRADLRHYQRIGVNWLSLLRSLGMGGILADDMGLGKTLQALAVLRPGTLVVAPTSVLSNWAREAARFRPDLSVNLYHGPARRLDPDADLTLTSYALLRLDADLLAGRRWDAVVLDEAQAVKNPDAQVARAAYRLQADFRLTMTGTPVENRLDELWSQMHFLNPGLLGGRADFQDRYAGPISQGQSGIAGRLRARLKPFLLRRLKRDVAPELPPRTEINLTCELSEHERAVYDAVRAATRKEVVEKLAAGSGVMAALEALLRLRQAACHTGLLPGQQAERSAKVDLLIEQLEEAVSEGHKALVFSQWTSLLDRVEGPLRQAGLDFVRLDGSTRDRGAVVDRFQADDGPPVMLISLKAGGAGLNLTAADNVFLLDPWWNPAVEAQAMDRAHRIGQDRPVLVTRLVAEDTVEERILALQERKRALADAALGGGDGAGSLTREDLMALLA